MDDSAEGAKRDNQSQPPPPAAEEMVKVVDRQGNVKVIPRSEYERKKRRRRRREPGKGLPIKEVVSVAFILAVIIIASYIALKILK